MLPIPLLAPKYLHSLPAPQYTPDIPWTSPTPTPSRSSQCPLCHLYPSGLSTYTPCQPPNTPLIPLHPWHPYTPSRPPMSPYATYIPSGCWVPTLPASPQYTHDTPCYPLMPPNVPQHPYTPRNPQCPLMPPIPLLVVNCHHFATDHFHAVKMLIFYLHFQLLLLYNWLSSRVHPVYKIQSLGVKNTSSVLWSSANFCSISPKYAL